MNYPNHTNKFSYKKLLLTILIILVASGLLLLLLDERTAPPIAKPVRVEQIPAMPENLTPKNERELQLQLQNIIASKKESNCELIKDPRYLAACHDFFRLNK